MRVGVILFGRYAEYEIASTTRFGYARDRASLEPDGPVHAFTFRHDRGRWWFERDEAEPRELADHGCFYADAYPAHVVALRSHLPGLDPRERLLLAAIAEGDPAAHEVLADHWISRGDEARGVFLRLHCEGAPGAARLLSDHGEAWRALATSNGFADDGFANGFLARPLALIAGEPLSECEALYRLSPRIYHELSGMPGDNGAVRLEAMRTSAAGEHERVIVSWIDWEPLNDREELIVRGLDHPNLPRFVERVRRRFGAGLAFAWPGRNLASILESRDGRLPLSPALAIVDQVIEATTALEERGIRNSFSPWNLFVAGDGTVTAHAFAYAHCAIPYPSDRGVDPPDLPRELSYRVLELLGAEFDVGDPPESLLRDLPVVVADVLRRPTTVAALRAGLRSAASVLALDIRPSVLADL